MKRSKILLWASVLALAGIIVWRIGFSVPEPYLPPVIRTAEAALSGTVRPGPNEPADEAEAQVDDPNATSKADETADPNADPQDNGTADPNASRQRPAGDRRRAPDVAEPNETDEAGNPMEAVNLKDVEMKKIIDKIAEWTGKTVIPHDDAMKQKITIYAPDKLPRPRALATIYSALRMKGFVVEEIDSMLFLKPIADAKLGVVPTIGADEPLAMVENRDQIVRKFFRLRNYPPGQMGQIIQPLVGAYGHVSVDEGTGMLLVIDTVGDLMSIQRIIEQFDVPESGRAVEQFFEIKYADPAEIVQLLRMLLGEAPMPAGRGRAPTSITRNVRPSQAGRGAAQSGAASSVVISAGDIPLVLIPVPKARWIIARGSAEDVKQVGEWIAKLDREEPIASESETVAITYADPQEVASRIEQALRDMPGAQLTPSILVRPLQTSRQIMIFGRPELRDMVKGLIADIDIPTGTFETKRFTLEYADPEQIKAHIDSLYGEEIPQYDSFYYYRYGRGSRGPDADTVKVIAFPTMGQVTVIASPENMRKIEKQIADWDVPLDVEAVKPRIIELQNSDPVQMSRLLTKLFTEEQDGSANLLRLIFYGRGGDQRKKIIGPLYGQLTFEEVPGTKKIIVISKIPQAYDVIEQLIYELDRQEMAEIPRVVQLQYADPEDLSERMNAMFNEPGTTARIRRTPRGLNEYSMDDRTQGQNQPAAARPQGGEGGGGGTNEYTPWWSAGARRNVDEEPLSNVIGRVRFIPDPRSKSILVLAPPQFQGDIEKTIRQLDTPGKQLLVKAIVVEVEHGSMTSLGVQLATNPGAFSNLGENAVTALGQLTNLATRGSAVASDTPLGAEGTGTIVGGTSAVYALIDFLIKTTHAKILNQQTLWTGDNEEAMFFKGQEVAFLAGSTSSANVGVTQNVEFKNVGMTMQVRPSITPERRVSMMIRVNLSQLTTEVINNQPVRSKVETETNMVVLDGETIMLGGMLFEKDTAVKRKLPLLGDLPLLGGLFQHNDVIQSNSELVVFVTPFVMDETTERMSAGARAEIEGSRQRLDEITGDLEQTRDELKEKTRKK
ncbi:secretin N-terminal domain-containing protein [Anaerobaca lacustris]|uniref:Secretin N-terminal domain-containing protein n=1 Tax=Anaerobaca lacustris TaxID=3044600 RepID=A0AAW6TWS8_9BACT|nr:secretin N-terminal domain-containing protein [Sedimentisphaerales bacterium M17dextr]